MKHEALFVALLLLAPAAAPQELDLPSPFDVIAASEDALELAVRPELRAELRAAFDAGRPLALEGLALPGRPAVHLRLRPVSALAPGARAVVIGAEGARRRIAPSVAMYAGHVAGEGGAAFLALSPTQAHGYVRAGGALFLLSSGPPRAAGSRVLARADALGAAAQTSPFCGVEGALPPSGDLALGSGEPRVRIADVFLELDHQYRALFASDQDAIDYAALLWTASSELYRRDLGAVLRIPDGYMRLWATTPPWGVIDGMEDIGAVQEWWTSPANPDLHLPRSGVHVLTSPVFGGIVFEIGALCNSSQSYAISSLTGHFPYPVEHTHLRNWDLLVASHETGHLFGSPHTFDYVPPIPCVDGSGPDQGTLMGYCHTSQGIENVGMRFHERVQERIRDFLEDEGFCIEQLPIARGDYDLDGAVEADDLAVLEGTLAQGFVSSGCLETFDFDGDGTLTSCDRALMAELVEGPGQVGCVAPDDCPCGNGGGCGGCASSAGAGSTLLGGGSASVAADDLVLTASGLPQGQNALFFMGQGTAQLPLGDGLRCAGGQAFRYGTVTTGAGTVQLGPGIVATSQASFPPAGRIEPGDSWAFQLWHRDPAGPCGQGSNLGPSYRVLFTP